MAMASRREHRGRQKRPSRGQRRQRRDAHVARARARDRPPVPAGRARDGRRPRRSDQLGQDALGARVPRRDRPGRLRRAAADARAGGAPAPERAARRRARRPRHRRGARQRATRRSSAAPPRWPRSPGEVLVLDEVQWADDSERGSAWTRLLLAGEYKHILLLGAVEALPLIQNAFPEAEVRFFERKAPLDWTGAVSFQSLKPGTVVVAFSRRAVLALAGELNRRQPGRVAVLYGAMPLGSRRLEIERFMNGQADVCCATDVLGHGVNLPCETLLFAESQKFDGEERRDLHAVGDRADRGPRRPLRPRRARPRRRADRDRLGERRPRPDRVGADAARAAPGRATWATASSTPRGSGRGSRICRSRARSSSRPRCARGTRPRYASGRRRAGSRSSRSARCSSGSTRVQRRLKRARPEPPARADVEARQRAGGRGQRRAARDARARGGRRPSAAAGARTGCSTRTDCATPRSRTPSRLRGPRASCAGSRSSTRTSAASRSSAPPSWRRPRPSASARSWRQRSRSPSVGRCKSCGQSCAPWFALCDRCYGRR